MISFLFLYFYVFFICIPALATLVQGLIPVCTSTTLGFLYKLAFCLKQSCFTFNSLSCSQQKQWSNYAKQHETFLCCMYNWIEYRHVGKDGVRSREYGVQSTVYGVRSLSLKRFLRFVSDFQTDSVFFTLFYFYFLVGFICLVFIVKLNICTTFFLQCMYTTTLSQNCAYIPINLQALLISLQELCKLSASYNLFSHLHQTWRRIKSDQAKIFIVKILS